MGVSNVNVGDMLDEYFSKRPPGYYDDPIKSSNPLDYANHVYIEGIDVPSWSHWKDNWRYIPDPSRQIVAKYHDQLKVLCELVWVRLQGGTPDLGRFLDVVADLSIEEANELMADKWVEFETKSFYRR